MQGKCNNGALMERRPKVEENMNQSRQSFWETHKDQK